MKLCHISLINNNLAGQKFETQNAAKRNKKNCEKNQKLSVCYH
jgi:hypothetical protein